MEIKELAKGINKKLKYYEFFSENLDNLRKIARRKTIWLYIFFRAENKKLITDNVVSVERGRAGHTLFNEIPIGKKVIFIAGNAMGFEGTAIGVIRIKEVRYLQIEIIPGKLYFYSYINGSSKCQLLEIVS